MKIKNKLIILVTILLITFGVILIIKKINEENPFFVQRSLIDLPDYCKKKAKGSGDCFGITIGYEYDISAKKCKQVSISGCSYFSPFRTLEECKKMCE